MLQEYGYDDKEAELMIQDCAAVAYGGKISIVAFQLMKIDSLWDSRLGYSMLPGPFLSRPDLSDTLHSPLLHSRCSFLLWCFTPRYRRKPRKTLLESLALPDFLLSRIVKTFRTLLRSPKRHFAGTRLLLRVRGALRSICL